MSSEFFTFVSLVTLLNTWARSCTCGGKEVNRYKHLIRAGNRAFALLKDKRVSGFRHASDLEVLFHRNDGRSIKSRHVYTDSYRKPDIIITSLAAARRASHEGSDYTWEELVGKLAIVQPHNPFTWLDVLSCQELKVGPKASFSPKPVSDERNPVPHFIPRSAEPEPEPNDMAEEFEDSDGELDEFEVRRPTKRMRTSLTGMLLAWFT